MFCVMRFWKIAVKLLISLVKLGQFGGLGMRLLCLTQCTLKYWTKTGGCFEGKSFWASLHLPVPLLPGLIMPRLGVEDDAPFGCRRWHPVLTCGREGERCRGPFHHAVTKHELAWMRTPLPLMVNNPPSVQCTSGLAIWYSSWMERMNHPLSAQWIINLSWKVFGIPILKLLFIQWKPQVSNQP